MKKILAFLLVLVMALTSMVGCDLISGLLGGTEDGPTLEEAKTYLFSTYKDAAAAIPNDYDLVGKVIIDGTSFTVTWTVDSEVITIKESSKANFWTVDLPDTNAEEVAYVLTATITDAKGNKVEVKFNKTLPVIDSTGIVTEPEEGVAYKLFLEQVNLGLTLFATDKSQKDEQKYIETTLDPKAAADYYVEKVDGGYKWYTTINGTKTYVYAQGIANDAGKISKYIGFSTENASVFTYVQEIATWQVVIDNIKYGVGTYGAYETVCISEVTYFKPDNINVADGQFPLTFMTKAYAETLTPDERPVASDPEANSTLTIKQALDLGQTKISNQYTEGKYYITGTVKEIKNETYGNLVLTDGTNDILIYGTYDATGANRFDAMTTKPAVGDTITVYGIIGQYSGTSQMKDGWITSTGSNNGGNNEVVDGIVFTFGDNGEAGTHVDGQEITETTTYTSGDYSLVISELSKIYAGGFDKTGNSILKFGTSSVAGTLTFTVPEDVLSVVIYAARYKNYADNNLLVVNGTTYSLTKNSDDGQYDAITIDTSSTKTIVLASAKDSGKPRLVIDKIVFSLTAGTTTTPDQGSDNTEDNNQSDANVNYGTKDAPVSTTAAVDACKNFASGDVSADLFYVTGVVKSIGETGSYYKNVYITDGTTDLLIYTISLGEGITEFAVGDTIVAYGYIKNYNGTIEMASNSGVYVYAVAVTPAA